MPKNPSVNAPPTPMPRFGLSSGWLLSLQLVGLASCDSLWSQYQGSNPKNCVVSPGICTDGQVCNVRTRVCELPELRLLAGALGGPGNVDGIGAEARFNTPVGVVADGLGAVYVADAMNHTIRKVVLSTGAVTTLVGSTGHSGSSDGIGTTARFNGPIGLAYDPTGTLYVSDTGNHTIRKVVLSTRAVTTLAGSAGQAGSKDNTGTNAQFNEPYGIELDGAGTLFVADSLNHTIRKVLVNTGMVSTLVGSAGMPGSTDGVGAMARFNRPLDVAIDNAGNLYVPDSYNQTVRKVAVSTSLVSTLAGSPGQAASDDGTGAGARFNGPSSLVSDGVGNLYVTDYGNHTIRKVAVSTGLVQTFAGSPGRTASTDGADTTARFYRPHGVAVDRDGTLYVTEVGNHTLRRVVSTGAVTTLAGTAPQIGSVDGTGTTARLASPVNMAVDGAGTLYVADNRNSTIRKVVFSTGAVTTLAGSAGSNGSTDGTGTAARFYGPEGIAIDSTGNLYVADQGNHIVRKVTASTGAVTTLAGSAGIPGIADGTGPAARFTSPIGVALDGAGNLYVTDLLNHTIRKVAISSGVVTTLVGAPGQAGSADGIGTAARFREPFGIASDGAGFLYVSENWNHTIRKIEVTTRSVATLAGLAGQAGSMDGTGATARFYNPLGLSLDGAGSLYVADYGNSTIRKIVLATASVTTFAGTAGQAGVKLGQMPGRLNRPRGLAFGPAGELFIAEQVENAILSIR